MKLFRSIQLKKEQENTIQKLHEKCVNVCDFLHPDDTEKARKCAADCSEQNRDLYRMANASTIAALFAVGLFVGSLVFAFSRK